MVMLVEVMGVDCGLVVDADEYRRMWQCGSEQGGDCFLYSMEFSVEHLSPTTEITFSRGEPVELLVAVVVDCTSTANCTVGEFRTVRIHDNCMVCECL